MAGLLVKENLQSLIYCGLQTSDLSDSARAYVMARFGVPDVPDLQLGNKPLSIHFLEQLQQGERGRYSLIADGCLFCASYQQSRLNRHFKDIGFLLMVGKSSYLGASAASRGKSNVLTLVYSELADKFMNAVGALATVFETEESLVDQKQYLLKYFAEHQDMDVLRFLAENKLLE